MSGSRPCRIVLAIVALLLHLSESASTTPINHVIVLMMENRSFDHMLGWLHEDYSPLIDGIDVVEAVTSAGLFEGESLPRMPGNPGLGRVPVTRMGYDIGPDDPKHDFDSTRFQIDHNAMDGFVASALLCGHNESNPVSMFDRDSAPILNQLAVEYAVFDRWFCSLPGPTDPNRYFAMSGTSRGDVTNFNGTLGTQQSYFDLLRQNNHTFGAYYQDDLWALGYFTDLNQPVNSRFVKDLDQYFFKDVAAGDLAEYVWLQPRMTTAGGLPTWQHPDASVLEGERLIKQVYEAIRASPIWNSTLFIITYDEHGGFYDHVTPPYQGVPAPDSILAPNGFAFDRLGVRIPTIAISPYIKKGTIVSTALPNEMPTPTSQFESTSIMATVHKILGLTDAGIPMLGDRAPWANTFAGIVQNVQRPDSDCPTTLKPLPDAPAGAWHEQRAKPLNGHMKCQLLFYCLQNHANEHAINKCPGREELMTNQGIASDWILAEVGVFLAKLRKSEVEWITQQQLLA